MDHRGVVSLYMSMIDADLALDGRAVVSLADDRRAVGIVANREMLELLGDVYRTRGCGVSVNPATGALEIRGSGARPAGSG